MRRLFILAAAFVALTEVAAFGSRRSQLRQAEVADAEGMLLLREPNVMLSALEDCQRASRVFNEWANSWARRAVVQNAVRIAHPAPLEQPRFRSRRTHNLAALASRTSKDAGDPRRVTGPRARRRASRADTVVLSRPAAPAHAHPGDSSPATSGPSAAYSLSPR